MKRAIYVAALACVALGFMAKVGIAAPSAKGGNEASNGILARTGKELFADDFARGDMKPKWRVGKGFFTLKDGAVTVAENPEDKHGAYAYITPGFVYKDIVIEYAVKMDGSRSCSLMLNDSKYKESHAGHILKATVSQGNKADLADWKFGAMKNEIYEKLKDEKTSADEKKRLRESIKDKSASFALDQDLSVWNRVRVEVVGDEMLMTVNGKPAAYLKSEGVAHATKNAIGFEVGGKSVQIKNVKVWEAAPSADWAAKRGTVMAALQK